MPVDNSDSVPNINDPLLAEAAGQFAATPDLWAKPEDRLVSAVRKLTEQRAQADWPHEGDDNVAVFVLVGHPRQAGELYGAASFVDPSAQEEPILGRLYFTSPDAAAGCSIPMPTGSNAIVDWLRDEKLGHCPTVIVYRGSRTISIRREGVHGEASNERFRDREPRATLQELEDALEDFHIDWLLTPVNCPKGVWETGRTHEYIPGALPEKAIQYALRVFLSGRFRRILKAEPEDLSSIGRVDIKLLKKQDPGRGWRYWAILELKVIKSFRNAAQGSTPSSVNNSANVHAIVEGVRQASSYAANRNTKGLLEIYDLRREKVDLVQNAQVSAAIRDCNARPTIHVWDMYGTSQDARNAGHTGA